MAVPIATPTPIRVKPNRQFPFLARHPWVHAHALSESLGDLSPGSVVDLLDCDGNWLARGLANPASRLPIRLYSFDPATELNQDFWRGRIDAALARRRWLDTVDAGTDDARDARRLVFSESDLMSGLIVDQYADYLSVQLTAGGLAAWSDGILDHLEQTICPSGIRVRIEAKTAKLEGIEPIDRWQGIEPTTGGVEYRQNGLSWKLDLATGQKTGGYLDQRINHRAAAKYLSGKQVLDVCCYHGGFGLVAAAAGAAGVLGIDSSDTALAEAKRNAELNGLSETVRFERGDCFDVLKRMTTEGRKFDAVILDPPRFAGSRHQVNAAMRAYMRLNSLAVDLLPPGGILVTCSCSGRVSRADFHGMLSDVGKRRRRDIVLLESRGAAPDHPVAAACPESDYLKCVIAEVN